MSYSSHHKQSPICLLLPWRLACLFPKDCCDLFRKKNGASFSRVGHDWLNWACQVLFQNKWLQMQGDLLQCLQGKIHDRAKVHSHASTPTTKKDSTIPLCCDVYVKRIKCTLSIVVNYILTEFWEKLCNVFEGLAYVWLIKIQVLLIMTIGHLMQDEITLTCHI